MTAALARRTLWQCGRLPAWAWMVLGLFALFAAGVPRFIAPGNLQNILRVGSVLCIAACGQAIVLILGGIEFSFGASAALASVVTVLSLPALGDLGGFAAGAASVLLVGAVNGVLVARFGLPPFLVTLGALMVASGLAATLAGGLPIDAPPSDVFAWPALGRIGGVLPVPVAVAAGCLALLALLLLRTRLGRSWYLAGANPVAARLAGLPLRRTVFAGYLAANGFAALAAIILTSRVASGQPSLAPDLPFETIAACSIGGIPLSGGQGRPSQVLCGVLAIAMMDNAVVLLNCPAAYQRLLIAFILIAAVLVPRLGRLAPRRPG